MKQPSTGNYNYTKHLKKCEYWFEGDNILIRPDKGICGDTTRYFKFKADVLSGGHVEHMRVITRFLGVRRYMKLKRKELIEAIKAFNQT